MPLPVALRVPSDALESFFPAFHPKYTNSLGLSISDDDDSPLLSSSTSESAPSYDNSEDITPINTVTLALGNLPSKSDSVQLASYFPHVDPNNPPWPAYRGYQEDSFADATMSGRLLTILSKAIDDTVKTMNEEWEAERVEDLVQCVRRMDKLMEDLSGNRTLRPIIDDGEADVALWNKEIARFFQGNDFMNAPGLFVEAYKYRRLHECFSTSRRWRDYDVFFRQKCDTFTRSSDAVSELAMRFGDLCDAVDCDDVEQKRERLTFLELAQVCLWGNSTDPRRPIGMSEEQQTQGMLSTGAYHAASEKNILANHLARLWDTVSGPAVRGGRIDFVLDNAGFELYCDCIYADYLIQSGLASQIRFHGKRFAWFVSDVTRKDWDWLLNVLVYGHLFPGAGVETLRRMGIRWKRYEKEGKWVYEQHPFWCTGYTFWDLHTEAPDLFLHLSGASLMLFKGDLNHRKLTYDCASPSVTRFDEAIGPMASVPGAPRVCSMRTIKSHVVVGFPDGSIVERLDREEPGWKISGKYAVVLLSEGRPGEEVCLG